MEDILIFFSSSDGIGILLCRNNFFLMTIFWGENSIPSMETISSFSNIRSCTLMTLNRKATYKKLIKFFLWSIRISYFFPCFIGQGLSQTVENVKKINCETSLVGFHDGWSMVLQNPEFFLSLCEGRALWFSGINSETSGIGFCLETGGNGDFQLWRRPFSHIKPEDFHGLVVTS